MFVKEHPEKKKELLEISHVIVKIDSVGRMGQKHMELSPKTEQKDRWKIRSDIQKNFRWERPQKLKRGHNQ